MPEQGVAVIRVLPWWHLWWLVFAILVFLILYVLQPACGMWGKGGWTGYCPAAYASHDIAGVDAARERGRALDAEVAQLEDALTRSPRCETGVPPGHSDGESAPLPTDRDAIDTERDARAPDEVEDNFDRRLAEKGATDGELMISLKWDSKSDLDLVVHCPGGGVINRDNPRGCGGHYNIDANKVAAESTDGPIEHVVYSAGGVKPGTYRVEVVYFTSRGGRRRCRAI